MINKTRNYDMFKLRTDNRAKIDQSHVKKLIRSIKAKNLLHLVPLQVNQNNEIMNGQHRYLAAKALGVEFYYEVCENFEPQDILLLNTSKSWTPLDFLNYYIKNGHQEYRKLDDYMKEHGIGLRIALALTMGSSKNAHQNFKEGHYVFNESSAKSDIETCWDTIGIIREANGVTNSNYANSTQFWKPLLILIQHPDFDREKWLHNLKIKIPKMAQRATQKDYLKLMLDIYNWKNHNKIKFEEDEEI